MTAITQTKQILEGLANKTVSNEKALEVVTNYLQYDSAEGLPNEEIAQKFVDHLFARVKRLVRAGATRTAQEDNLAVVQAASDASVVDLE